MIVHGVLIYGSSRYWIPGAEVRKEETRKLFDIKDIDFEIQKPKLTRREAVKSYVEKLKFKQPESSSVVNKRVIGVGPSDVRVDAPEVKEQISDVDKNLQVSDQAVFQSRMKETKKTIDAENASELNIFAALNVNENLIDGEIVIPELFKNNMYGFAPSYRPPSEGFGQFGASAVQGTAFGMGESAHESIDDFMTTSMQTYIDPKDGQGYYRLAIAPGSGAGVLQVLPKELIFLVDASLSIRDYRLENFAKGIKYAIRNLNPEDRFNVYTFKDKITPLSLSPLVSNDVTTRKAVNFLNRLEPSEQTDIYEAFLESIQNKSSMQPSYIVFLSDGNPTQGLTSSAKLIGKISKINRRSRSIFSFSGGKKVNRYLLDFLSYQNRGWSEYAAENFQIDDRIQDLYDKIKNPLLMDVKFQLNGLDETEVYPKHLPDFYLNTEFIVYGKFRAEDKFTMRVIGQARDGSKELIFSQRISDAVQGSKDIKMYWAFNKYYHLISRITLEGESSELINELKSVSKKYGIKSPYFL